MTDIPTRRWALLALPGAAAALAGCSQAVGSVLPTADLPPLPGLSGSDGKPVPGFRPDEFKRGVAILNVFASWCPYCRAEHEHLQRIAADKRFRLLGLAIRDTPEKAAAYLRGAGNPYAAVAADDGRLAAFLGQKAVPNTYVLERDGRIHARIKNALDADLVATRLLPAAERALGRSRMALAD